MPAESTMPGDPSRTVSRWFPLLVVLFAMVAAPLAGSAHSAVAGPSAATPDDEILRAGADAYGVCAGCHQAGGVGLGDQFPPLVDNPNVADAAYVEDVIRNGVSGPIEVNGVTYDSVMPAQALSDPEIVAVIAYIQSGFAAPATPAPAVDTGPVAGTELPTLANWAYLVAIAIAVGLGALVLGPRVIAAHDRREISWVDAWMKTAVIVVASVVSIVIIPAKVLEFETVQELPRAAQDIIALGLWGGAVAAALLALWYAHRERRV